MNPPERLRILLVDDNPSIHEDFRKVLGGNAATPKSLGAARAAFLGAGDLNSGGDVDREVFEIDSAYQGEEALTKVQAACAANRAYSLAFVDVRMPPGWDGVHTIREIWKVDADLQTVICTAFSDYSWEEMIGRLGRSDRLLILKKPFDAIEIRQLASGLTRKWSMIKRERGLIDDLRRAEHEARAYASSLETVNRALMTAKAAADKSLQMKADFLAQIAAQLQEQMHHIFGGVEVLRQLGDPHTALAPGLERILDSSRHLIAIFDSILELTQIESGQLRLERTEFNLMEAVRATMERFRNMVDASRLQLLLEVCGSLPERIQSNAIRFDQILSELLDNALRHTTDGSVRVVLALEHTEDWREPLLRIDVVDTGCGVPEEHFGKIFEPFYRAPLRDDDAHAGLGLGLARQLAQLLGGDITLTRNADRGSTFTLRLEVGDLKLAKMLA